MRDFRREVKAASELSIELPATEFSWSLTRHLLFRKCERAYFLHYYFTQGGWDRYADSVVRSAYDAKKSMTYEEYLDGIADRAMKTAFDRIRFVRPEFRFKIFRKIFEEILYGELDRCGEVELFNFSLPLDDLYRKMRYDLANSCSALFHSAPFGMLLKMQKSNLINRNIDFECYHGDTRIWSNPGILWSEPGCRCSLRIQYFPFSEEICRLTADVFAYYSRELLKTENSISFFIVPDGGEWNVVQFSGDAGFGNEMIADSISRMKAKLRPGHLVCQDDFREAGLPELCKECKFSLPCSILREL